MIANLPRFLKRNRTAPIHFSPRDAIGTTSGTPTGARAAGDVGPYHAPRHVRTRTSRAAHARHVRTRTPCAHLVGRDVLGAPRPRDNIRDAHVYAGRRGRRPLPCSTPRPSGRARRPRRAAPTERHRERHGRAGRRGRRPLPRSAPHPHTHIARRTRTPRPHTHAMRAPGPARRPRRAVAHENAIGDAHGDAGRRGRRPLPRTAPCPHTHTARRTRTPRAAHARHARTW